MTDTATPAELVVPLAAIQEGALACVEYQINDSLDDVAEDVLKAGAPLIVAAELRRIAEDGTGWAIATHLRARADELDGGGQ